MSRSVWPIPALGHNAFKAELARVPEHDGAIRTVNVFGELYASVELGIGLSVLQKARQSVAARFPRLPLQVMAINLQQVKRV